MEGILGTTTVTQIGIIVRDLETTKKKFAEFFGVPIPPTCDGGEYAVTKTTYMGEPAPEANCWMAFFDLPNLQMELIQPNGIKSTWQDFLDEKGEGIHHIAFGVKNTNEKIKVMEAFGSTVVQRGYYGGGNGEYTYLENKDMKIMLELLESY